MPRKQKIDRDRVNNSLNTLCPKCGYSITPSQVVRVDFQRMECPNCKERFISRGGIRMTDRVRFITHERKQILLLDLSNCSASEVERIIRGLPELVTTRPRNSVLILSDFTGASFDEEAFRAMKEAAVFDKPFVKRSAWVGAEKLEAFSEKMRSFSRRDFPAFETREEALAWLVKE